MRHLPLLVNNYSLIIILSLGFILRLINLNQSLWLDEATQVILSSKSLSYIFFERGGDFHPPLSYILTHFWLYLGSSEIWLRLQPVLFGVGTIWVIYLLTKKIFNRKLAILTAFFLAIAPYHVYYSQEVRMYSMVTFFASLSMYYFLAGKRAGYIFSTAVILYTHYLGIFLVLAQIIHLLWKKQLSLNINHYFLIILLYIPWLPQFLTQLKFGLEAQAFLPGWGEVLSVPFYKAIPLTLVKFSLGRIDFSNIYFYIFITFVIFLVFGYSLLLGVKKAYRLQPLLIWWLFIPIILALMISFKLPLYQPFRILFIIPAFYMLIAFGIQNSDKLKNILLVGVIGLSLFGLSIYYTNPFFWREDWKGATQFISSEVKEDSMVVFAWSEPFAPYLWYGRDLSGVGIVDKIPATDVEVSENMDKLKVNSRIYVFEYLQQLSDPDKFIQKWLQNSGYLEKQVYDFRGVGFVDLYEK